MLYNTSPDSSWIQSITYDPDSKLLVLKTKSGKSYDFPDVHPDDHQALCGAKSCGEHFNKVFRPKYGH